VITGLPKQTSFARAIRPRRAAPRSLSLWKHTSLGRPRQRATPGPAGLPVRLLGAATPADALTDAVRRLNPSRVVVWSSLPRTGRPDLFGRLPSQRPAVMPVAAGPGWEQVELSDGMVRVTSLREAVDAVTSPAGLAPDA
jgi:MerR family transcriptional regulator, light-induced transcriptional regulator